MTQRASDQRKRAVLALSLALTLAVLLTLGSGLAVSADPFLMPLDDAYIHFQYARQWAAGEPMTYYSGAPATSGETSLLYAPLLALGWSLGFAGWRLGYWAAGLEIVSLAGSAWLVYRLGDASPLARTTRADSRYALLMALAFAVSGPFVWAALSGMETMLFVWAALITAHAAQRERLQLTAGAAALLPLLRPEGAILAGLVTAWLALRLPWPRTASARLQRAAWLGLPLVASLVQPAVNLAATGTVTSSGMQAKSHFYNVGAAPLERAGDMVGAFARIWHELLIGRSADFGVFTSPLLGPAALAALVAGSVFGWKRRRLPFAVLIVTWVIALSAAVATLDTAFWQFKRYQLPVMVLFFPAAAWAAAGLGERIEATPLPRWLRWALPALILLPSVLTTLTFARNYAANVEVVRDQQLPMARWVREHLALDARIAVHDVGLMAYFGERPLYDVVGLTTRGAAPAWREGPGAIFETMAHSLHRPDFFAIYPDVQGLRYLVDAGVMGEVLAEFPKDLPARNVAAATGYQAVYAADWSATRPNEIAAQTTTLDATASFTLIDQIDVAHLESEAAHGYEWWQAGDVPGFLTEAYRHVYHACGLPDEAACWAADGGRGLSGGERFTVRSHPGEDLLLVTRVHGRTTAHLAVFVNGARVATPVQPAVPGRWLEIATLVPGDRITGDSTDIRVEVVGADLGDAVYWPYYHWAFQGSFSPEMTAAPARAVFGPAGEVELIDVAIAANGEVIAVDVLWRGPASLTGDGVVFIHLYNTDERDRDPVAQVVRRPGGGVLPPANWLPGVISERFEVPTGSLPPGRYAVALGFFEAVTGERYAVTGDGADADRRLWIGEVTR